ncbi:MAG: hypothetical protein ONB46_25480 [candidate division KSB1 bacterium]|nr:hypothetical protein [candidate division KSB1 bacterium]MDZ7369274.1 hypothetical protein [candidate division KSB1 bacterium]MDZ7407309.1 hypothetical protein [candidate division KSB1 bacterium]
MASKENVTEKRFLDFLGGSLDDRIRCDFATRKGKVIRISVVQYETFWQNKWLPVVRYDTAHGFFHRDVYFFGGTKHFKEFVLKPSLEEALTYAIQDIRLNWQKIQTSILAPRQWHKKTLKKIKPSSTMWIVGRIS